MPTSEAKLTEAAMQLTPRQRARLAAAFVTQARLELFQTDPATRVLIVQPAGELLSAGFVLPNPTKDQV